MKAFSDTQQAALKNIRSIFIFPPRNIKVAIQSFFNVFEMAIADSIVEEAKSLGLDLKYEHGVAPPNATSAEIDVFSRCGRKLTLGDDEANWLFAQTT